MFKIENNLTLSCDKSDIDNIVFDYELISSEDLKIFKESIKNLTKDTKCLK